MVVDERSDASAPDQGASPNEQAAAEPRPHSTPGVGRWLARLFLSLFLLGLLAVVAGYYYVQRTLQQPLTFADQTYSINTGDSLASFLQQLADTGVIAETLTPRLFARYQDGLSEQLHTGDYRFKEGLSLREVLNQITTGQGQITSMLTVIEGMTFADFRAQLAASGINNTLASQSDAELMKTLFDLEQHPEGLFFPESYQFRSKDTDETILRRAYQMMQGHLREVWASRDPDLPLKTPYEALILASIIEKETGLASERPLIAGVFTNRLRKGMLLQTDPTVIYGLGDQFDGNLTRKHLRTDTPHNTYTRKGLPPTPICLPGLASLQAAVHPEKTDALYFVAKGGGAHYFSKTLKEHNRAVRKYQLKQ